MRLGAFDHLAKPIGRDDLNALLQRMLPRTRPARPAGVDQSEQETLVGSSEAMRRVQKTIGLAADSDATVLVLGETGTGKELVARALHEHGRRKAKPFIAVNCAAIPGDLLESELFGHVKGAFTGAASDRTGAFREANGGTLLLDEIGDMPPAMQATILGVLQDQGVIPVGARPGAVAGAGSKLLRGTCGLACGAPADSARTARGSHDPPGAGCLRRQPCGGGATSQRSSSAAVRKDAALRPSALGCVRRNDSRCRERR